MLPATPAIINAMSRAIGMRLRDDARDAGARAGGDTGGRRMTEYVFPSTPEEAVACLAEGAGPRHDHRGRHGRAAGHRKGKARPALPRGHHADPGIVAAIEVSDDEVTIGAAVPFIALREHPYLARTVHALVEAAASVGALADPVLRNLGRQPGAGNARGGRRDHRDRAGRGGCACWIANGARLATRRRSLYRARAARGSIRRGNSSRTSAFRSRGDTWGTAWRRAGRRPSLVLPTLNCAVKVRARRRRHRGRDDRDGAGRTLPRPRERCGSVSARAAARA